MQSDPLAKEPMTVLCVEDDPVTRKLFKKMLERRFERVLEARDGEEGLDLFHQHHPALVFTDLMMPRMDGISMARAIKVENRDTRIIILTSVEDLKFLLAAIEIGVTEYLLKPLTQARLDDALDRCLRVAALELRLRDTRADLASILESIADAFFALDPEWRFTYVNAMAQALFARTGPELLGRTYWSLFQGATQVEDAYRDAMRTGQIRTLQAPRDSVGRWLEHRIFPLGGGISVFVRDISEEKRTQQEIHFLAFYDKLTGLPNRSLLEDRLVSTIARCKRDRLNGALLFLDLDRFKYINDSLGHAIGDQVLRETADRLKDCLRECDTVARLGGDEFIVLLDGTDLPDNVNVVARRILGRLSEDLKIQAFPLNLSASVGVAMIPADGDRPDDLLKAADTAMYFSKGKGGNAYHFYQPEMNQISHEHLLLEGALRQAILDRGFQVHYQPQYDLQTRSLVGFEALARLELPGLGRISPAQFIPLMEDTGLIIALGEWVMETACRQGQDWQARFGVPVRMAVNVSGRQFWQGDMVGTVQRVLVETGFPAGQLELEITESMVMHEVGKAIDRMACLAAMGVRLAIDDFGTGYSSLACLRRFPIRTLKIDCSFIKDLVGDPEVEAIPVAILALARSMRLEVVAEGIEHEAQLEFLVRAGCAMGQGFLLGQPMAPREVEATLF